MFKTSFKKKENKMTTTNKTELTAAQKYDIFVEANGSDASKMTEENAKLFGRLLQKKISEANPKKTGVRASELIEDKKEYEALCAAHGIKVSDKFQGWEVVAKPGPKKDGVETVSQHIVGLKWKLDENDRSTRKITSLVSPKGYNKDVETAEKVIAAKALAAL